MKLTPVFRGCLLGLAVLSSTINSQAAPVSVPNGVQYVDTNGRGVQAHGGGMIKVGSYYYWFGESRHTDDSFYGVSCYRSADLKTWEFRNSVLLQTSNTELATCVIERPKVIYCAATGKFVMWMHWENGKDYSAARAAVATCSTVDGNYTYLGSFRPNNNMSRDCNLFVDTDNAAYFISTSNDNKDLSVYYLTSDYQSVSRQVATLYAGQYREAPALFKRGSYYYLISSTTSGWNPNQQKYAYSNNISSGWSGLSNIGDATCYNSQTSYVLPIQGSAGTSYLFMGDRWAGASGQPVNNSSYVWLPITFNSNTSLSMSYYDPLTIDVSAGTLGTGGGSIAGTHSIINVQNGEAVDNAGSNAQNAGVILWASNGGNAQKWNFTQNSDTSWNIVSVFSGQALNDGNSSANGAQMIQYPSNTGDANQRWWVDKQSDGTFKIWNKANSKSLDSGNKSGNNLPLIQWDYSGGGQQRWNLQ